MKARYQYRLYPTNKQKGLLSQLFGCVRVVWNDTLAYCQELDQQGEKKPKYTKLSRRLTQIKKTEADGSIDGAKKVIEQFQFIEHGRNSMNKMKRNIKNYLNVLQT